LFESFYNWLLEQGFAENFARVIAYTSKILAVLIAAWIIDLIAKRYLLVVARFIVKRTHAKWGEIIVQRKVLYKIAHVAPALVIYFSSTYLFPESDQLIVGIKTVTLAYIALVVAWFINSFLSASVDIYQFYEISRHRPIKGYIQALRLLVTIIAGHKS